MSNKWLLCLGAFLGLIGVAAGAFGAHALKNKLDQNMLSVFEVGVRYQMYHALAIVLVAGLSLLLPGSLLTLSGWFFIGGTVIFSGSLYLLAFTGIGTFGAVTPIGGLFLLLGWLSLLLSPFFST
ncbi:MAG: DUF423 domain-containing protein [Chlamydiales bacterium]|nr:DUF423 domain-containing protein [Chlamydiales bacterium]